MAKKWAKHQPKDGDCILVCGHDDSKTYHWYALDMDKADNSMKELEFTAPDGTEGSSKWVCICSDCNRRYDGDPRKAIRGIRKWVGDDPIIPEYTQ